jgi:tRNA-binding EMAP/Myf-like protein
MDNCRANMEPATLRGQKSGGMLLAAQDGPKVVCLTVAEPVAPSSRARQRPERP